MTLNVVAGRIVQKGDDVATPSRKAICAFVMDRDDILNLFIVTNLPLPKGALLPSKSPAQFGDGDIPF